MSKVNLEQKLAGFTEHWSPKIVAGFNGHDVMVVKAKGEFVWHSHPDTDDFFLVLKGRLTISSATVTCISGRVISMSFLAAWSIAPSPTRRFTCC